MVTAFVLAILVAQKGQPSIRGFFNRPKNAYDARFVRVLSSNQVVIEPSTLSQRKNVIVRLSGLTSRSIKPGRLEQIDRVVRNSVENWNLVVVPQRDGTVRIGYKLWTGNGIERSGGASRRVFELSDTLKGALLDPSKKPVPRWEPLLEDLGFRFASLNVWATTPNLSIEFTRGT